MNSDALRVIQIGGAREIGKNLTVYEYAGKLLIQDCGLSFPGTDQPGVDFVIPDLTFIEQNAERVVGMILTHGHEDHQGAISFLLKAIGRKLEIYATDMSIGIARHRIEEAGVMNWAEFITVATGDTFRVGPFEIETVHTNHSIPGNFAVRLKAGDTTLLHTGDFKFDERPIDKRPIDLDRFHAIGLEGVDLMMVDTTNIVRDGFSPSESTVGEELDRLFGEINGRIMITCFASHVHRLQQVFNVAGKHRRKVAVTGRSLDKVIAVARSLGYLKFRPEDYVELAQTQHMRDHEVVFLVTGSQGEPHSALDQIADKRHGQVAIREGDTVIFSATPIPGNESSVNSTINRLTMLGAEVLTERHGPVHSSGHAYRGEIKRLVELVKPKLAIPTHGEFRHYAEFVKMAGELGYRADRVILPQNGDVLEVHNGDVDVVGTVPAEDILVDGLGVGDVGKSVLNERRKLSRQGVFVAMVPVDKNLKMLTGRPEFFSRGFVYMPESIYLLEMAEDKIHEVMRAVFKEKVRDVRVIEERLMHALTKVFYRELSRRPVMDVRLIGVPREPL